MGDSDKPGALAFAALLRLYPIFSTFCKSCCYLPFIEDTHLKIILDFSETQRPISSVPAGLVALRTPAPAQLPLPPGTAAPWELLVLPLPCLPSWSKESDLLC